MSEFNLNDLTPDDVVHLPERYKVFESTRTCKVSELTGIISNWLLGQPTSQMFSQLAKDGLECEILKTEGGGWKKGRLILQLKFMSDETHDQPTQ